MKSPETDAHVSAIITYPVKSLPGVRRQVVRVTRNGLDGDRLFALAEAEKDKGGVAHRLTLRECPGLSAITPAYVSDGVVLNKDGMPPLFLPAGIRRGRVVPVKAFRGVMTMAGIYAGFEAADWLSEAVGKSAQVVAIPDNMRRTIAEREQRPGATTLTGRGTDGYPIHYISIPSLQALNTARAQGGLPAVGPERFRANIEISGPFEPFEEDAWKGVAIGGPVPTKLLVIRACARCATIEANPNTRQRDRNVMGSLVSLRAGMQSSNPPGVIFGTWAAPAITSVGREIAVGQAVAPIA